MSQERFDVVLDILSGPLKSLGEQIYRGPIVRIGANPGPGGVELTGYRGLDPRHCTITAYDGGSVAIAPVGTNQVRMAPHANVNWKDIDPIRGPEFLSRGAAFHVGPVNRGATMQFVECRSLGVWKSGDMRSDVASDMHGSSRMGQQIAGAQGFGSTVGGGLVPSAYDARKVGKVRASSIPAWVIGCVPLILGMTAFTLIMIPVAGIYMVDNNERLGPVLKDTERFKSVNLDAIPRLLTFEDTKQAYFDFVVVPNMQQAGANQGELDEEKRWDKTFLNAVNLSMESHVEQEKFFRNLERKHREWAIVLKHVRRAKLPDVFAAVPYQESLYSPSIQSHACARGYWQFMPETASRVAKQTGLDFKVGQCRLRGVKQNWSPTKDAPPPTSRSIYIDKTAPLRDQCLIDTCQLDNRDDLDLSSKAAMHALGEAWHDPTIAASGSAVQVTILSHNAGYDDRRYGKRGRTNLLPALERWNKKNGVDQGPFFYGQNILAPSWDHPNTAGSLLMPETQHYAYNIVAQHLLAVCYYSKEHGELPAFAPWSKYALPKSYCSKFKIPTKAEAKGYR